MDSSQIVYTRSQRIGIAVFIAAILATSAMITMGLLGLPWPRWLLDLALIF